MSTSQKRDADMDRLLRAALKPAPHDRAGDCPDAGVLAAFVEGALEAAELSAVEAHLAGCGRCQETLAVLSQEPPQEETDLAARESGWFTWVTRPRLRWLVPISAAATVAVVFLATRPLIAPENEGPPSSEVVQMAQAPAPPAELPAVGAEASRGKASAVPEKSEFAAPPGRQATGKREADQLAGTRQAADVPPATEPRPAAKGKKALAETVAPGASDRVAADEQRSRAAAEPVAPQAAAAPAAALQLKEELRRLQPLALVTAPPDGRVQWQLGPGGRIWRSTDAGSTWHGQLSGVSANLVAGSAPSATTCWAVGDAGIVLLTEDGQRWALLPFPVRVDLAAVQAADSRIATVTTRDGRRFQTLDAGRTWSPKQ